MAIHDAYARQTPYEIAIPGREFARDRFARIRDEAAARQTDARDPARFVFLGEVGNAIAAVAGEELVGPTDDDPHAGIRQHGSILFHAFHFWAGGEALFLLSTPGARALVGSEPERRDSAPVPPNDTGYLQLPRNLFWGQATEGGVAEPVDGLFWALGHGGVVNALAVLGVREDRPGVSVVDLPGITEDVFLDALNEPSRESGRDFETDLPGGELEGLYSIQTGAELVKLLGRMFALLERTPEALGAQETGPRETPPDGPGSGPGDPRPSSLPFRRIASAAGYAADGGADG